MCGIWAVFGSQGDVTEQSRAVHTIRHRGPDAFRLETVNHFTNCCLGFHRLAIMDDSKGMQPMRLFTHPHLYLVYNGEIYNHKLLEETYSLAVSTECDGEPLLHLYDRLGPWAMARQLDGVFAFCIVDLAGRKVALGRDTYGVKPLYKLHTDDGFLAVCSEAKGLLRLPHQLSDRDAGIVPFPPGHVEVYDLDPQGRATLSYQRRFHTAGEAPVYRTLVSPGSEDVRQNIRTLFEAAVKKRLMAERRLGCMLSGGLDSSLVAAYLVKLSKALGLPYPIQSFSIGTKDSPDLKAARKVADHLGTEHHEVLFTVDEGLDVIPQVIYHVESYDLGVVRSSTGMYLLSRYIKEKTDTTVILSGEGSDELAQGYIYFHQAPSALDADRESRRLLDDLHLYDVLRCDRSTAAWGLEVRVPFLDHLLTSYFLSLLPEQRQPQHGTEKHLLRSAFDDGHLLPEDILWRPKEAFSDGLCSQDKSWFEHVEDFCQELISDRDLEMARTQYAHNPPASKEALYYRRLFDQRFPGKAHWTPYYWLPKWSDSKDPSARTLQHYKQ